MLAVIGGSGLTQLANLDITRREVVRTPYGEPSGPLTFGRLAGRELVFIARHGYGHTIPPHRVNYRANISALRSAGVTHIVSVASVGGIRADLGPGALVVPDQIIDYTWGRHSTFFDAHDGQVRHIDFTEPYDAALRERLIEAAALAGETVVDGAVYAATQGPRLETAAEINRYERDGADVVGMTGMPEAALAREAGLAYAALNVVVNHAAGRGDSAHGIRMADIEAMLQEAMVRVRHVLEKVCESGVCR
ncbi:S-methyl-5'-thioinosine phosphorylase [Methyloversatilis thermotolerans]|uniref:S-methyl-5'-thioinosine phosphorylase n=1 Tax=Methyloversatilis thermotolerans TaxID=1346290 RepID=UPI000370A147|nr:S-methyl-5'-thioinosine phosphorylase [Methyloversatilis thermotolerans]